MKKINWKDFFFPILADIREINRETDTDYVSSNNWELANQKDAYDEIIKKIDAKKSNQPDDQNVIIISN